MMMTPIKIRGKNARNQSNDVTSVDSSASESVSYCPDPTPFPRSYPNRRRLIMTEKLQKAASSIETLPPELLEMIVVESCSVNFVLSSPLIAAKVSNKHVYKQLCRKAFNFGPTAMPKRDPEVQSALMKTKWFTIDLMKRLERECSECKKLVKEKCRYLHYKCREPLDQLSNTEKFTIHAAAMWVRPHTPEERPLSEYVWEIDRPWTKSEHRHCSPGCRLPTAVLRGPAISSKVTHGTMMIEWGAKVDWENTTDGEIAEKSLRDAVTYGGENFHVFSSVRYFTTPAIGVRPDTDMVLHAITEGGCKKDTVQLLEMMDSMHHGRRSIDWDDRRILAHGVRLSELDPDNGGWLLETIRRHQRMAAVSRRPLTAIEAIDANLPPFPPSPEPPEFMNVLDFEIPLQFLNPPGLEDSVHSVDLPGSPEGTP